MYDYDDSFDNDPLFNNETGEDYNPEPADYFAAFGAAWDEVPE